MGRILRSVTAPLPDEHLRQIIERDARTADGVVTVDYLCAEDRHVLLVEINRLRGVLQREQRAQPVNRTEGLPWMV